MWEVYDAEVAKYGGRLAWDGEYPNSKECREANLYCYWESIPEPERSWAGRWVRCTKDHPEAIPDMNTFLSWARWDKVARKMVYRGISGYGGSPSN